MLNSIDDKIELIIGIVGLIIVGGCLLSIHKDKFKRS